MMKRVVVVVVLVAIVSCLAFHCDFFLFFFCFSSSQSVSQWQIYCQNRDTTEMKLFNYFNGTLRTKTWQRRTKKKKKKFGEKNEILVERKNEAQQGEEKQNQLNHETIRRGNTMTRERCMRGWQWQSKLYWIWASPTI